MLNRNESEQFDRRQWLVRVWHNVGLIALAASSSRMVDASEVNGGENGRLKQMSVQTLAHAVWENRPLGIFTHIVPGHHAAKAKAVRAAGLNCVQWYPLLDRDEMTEAEFKRVANCYEDQGVGLAAIAGYANLFDPRPDARRQERERLSLTLRLAPASRCPFVCTEPGTLNPLKGSHPDNTKPEIWREFVDLIGRYLEEAERAGSVFVLEPYTKNICRDAHDVTRLLKELGSVRALRFVMDPFNVLYERELLAQRPVLTEYFRLLSPRCVVAHAKDLTFESGEKVTPRAGTGNFDWVAYGELLNSEIPTVPLILEHLKWAELESTLAFVRAQLHRTK